MRSLLPLVLAAATVQGCATSNNDGANAAPASLDGSNGACVTCVTDTDCGGGVCAQFGGDTYCAVLCPTGNECTSERTCATLASTSGQQVNACIPKNDLCGPNGGPGDAGPTNCAPAANSGSKGDCVFDAGSGPIVGTVGPTGGTMSRLFFSIVGDTRPPVIDDTKGYPSAIITDIYTSIAALSPMPAFSVSTGDYMFASTGRSQSAPQLDMYLAARGKYPGTFFPAMGNHECTGATASNCGPGIGSGTTANYNDFMSKLLAPIGKTTPYYAINVNASDNGWTSKLVFIAANSWDSAQAAWLETTLAAPTTYTFIVRHEPQAARTAPGVGPSESIMANHPYTLAIVGHTHTYGKTASKQVTIGNGGAPLTGGVNYGFGLVVQRADGAIQVDMIDYQSGLADPSFRFALKADGSPAP